MEITLERDTANDESAVIVAIFVASGSAVEDDELIAEFENSKATQELRAPRAGVLLHELAVGQEVAFGVPIARIVDVGTVAAPLLPGASLEKAVEAAAPVSDVAVAARTPPKFSNAARALLATLGLSENLFETGLVTAAAVQAKLPGGGGVAPVAPAKPALPKTGAVAGAPPGLGNAVDRRKQTEIETLSAGAGATMLSVLGTTLGEVRLTRGPADMFRGRITDLVIYEAARLMRKFPKLNGYYADGRVVLHEDVHAGIAIDGGGKLVVYGIEHADQVGLPELSGIVEDAVGRYLNNQLSAGEMMRATFTVTDLSADELDFVLPLLPRGQSCIIGITHDDRSGFRLFAGFDHRVTEGREVGAFLGELGRRVSSFGGKHEIAASRLECGFCGKSMAQAAGPGRDKGLLSVVDRTGARVLCCAGCWNGW